MAVHSTFWEGFSMRTDLLRKYQARQRVNSALNAKNRYEMSGSIRFGFELGMSTDSSTLTALRARIKRAEYSGHMWRENGAIAGRTLSDGEVMEFGLAAHEVQCWFEINHFDSDFSRSQTWAYEKYLTSLAEAIAEDLSKDPIDGVSSVAAVLVMGSQSHFKVRAKK